MEEVVDSGDVRVSLVVGRARQEHVAQVLAEGGGSHRGLVGQAAVCQTMATTYQC